MKKFETVEQAQEEFNKIQAEFEAFKKKADEESQALNKRVEDAEAAALSAIHEFNDATENEVVSIGKKKYEILFGVDGFSKSALKEETKLLEKLVAKGSAAIKLID